MSTEETNGFSAPNEDANVAGDEPLQADPAGQAGEKKESATSEDENSQG